jgi:histidinol-phosphate aminotransferase
MGDPSFSEYDFAAKIMGGEVIKVPLKNFTHDLKAMAQRISPLTKMIFVCNPNNPTGTMVPQAEVTAFMKAVPEDVLVIFDEAYFEYVDDPHYPDSLQYVREGRNVIVLRTFSKVYGLAGLRIGYGIAPQKIISAVNRVREPFNVNLLAQKAALAALEDEEFVERSRAMNREGKEMLYGALAKLNLRYIPSQANFIFIDAGLDCQELFKKLLLKGVIVRTGDIFGYPTFIRVTVGRREENAKFLRCLQEVLEDKA